MLNWSSPLSGMDATRAFISGEFNSGGLVDNIDGLTDEECVALSDWEKLYNGDYSYVGKVVGNFYHEDGTETDALKDFKEKLKRGLESKEKDKSQKISFPECNSKWSKEEGTMVWCTNERYCISETIHFIKSTCQWMCQSWHLECHLTLKWVSTVLIIQCSQGRLWHGAVKFTETFIRCGLEYSRIGIHKI